MAEDVGVQLVEVERRVAALERVAVDSTSRRLRVRFPAANTKRDIAHGLGVVPSGYRVEWANAEVHATPGTLWTTEMAYLQANAANTEAVVTFYFTPEETLDEFTG